MNFYEQTIQRAIQKLILNTSDRILVVAGGYTDRATFLKNKFNDVTITNLDYREGARDYEPYKYENQDAENLSYANDEFDWVFVHAGLHHCASPHKALCEMLRVAKKGIGVFEARDSFLNRLSNNLKMVPEYELEPSVLSGGEYGGWKNTHIPNYVYRWTEREVQKTVNSFLPHYIHKYYFYYGLRIPTERLSMSTSPVKRAMGSFAKMIGPLFRLVFPKQGNCFGFFVTKYGMLQPWLKMEEVNILFNLDYCKREFNPKKYKNS